MRSVLLFIAIVSCFSVAGQPRSKKVWMAGKVMHPTRTRMAIDFFSEKDSLLYSMVADKDTFYAFLANRSALEMSTYVRFTDLDMKEKIAAAGPSCLGIFDKGLYTYYETMFIFRRKVQGDTLLYDIGSGAQSTYNTPPAFRFAPNTDSVVNFAHDSLEMFISCWASFIKKNMPDTILVDINCHNGVYEEKPVELSQERGYHLKAMLIKYGLPESRIRVWYKGNAVPPFITRRWEGLPTREEDAQSCLCYFSLALK